MGKKIMIVGASFKDKGSQSTLFVVIDELRKRFEDCQIFFACNGEQFEETNYRFKKMSYTKQFQDMALGARLNIFNNISKLIRKKDDTASKDDDAQKFFSELDLIIDISDSVLTDRSTMAETEGYLKNIKIAQKFNIPMIILPQSFGPFNYSLDDMHIMGEMKDLLFYPKAIYAREEEGYDELIGNFGLDNLRRSPDLVLQNKGINILNVCTSFYSPIIPDIKEGNNVAVIPNESLFTKNISNKNYALFFKMIEKLINSKKEVYVFCLASSDLEICKKMTALFSYNDHVHLIDQEFDCIEYDFIVKYFDFVLSSRYHGCVHAYRNLVPSIIFGTSPKDKDLAKLMNQEQYYVDILSDTFSDRDWMNAMDGMLEYKDKEKEIIRTRLEEIQSSNCFEVLDELGW